MGFKKIFFQVVLMIAIALGVYLIANIGLTYRAKSSARLEQIWKQDIENLLQAQKLPQFWSEIRLVEKDPGHDDAMALLWSKTVSPPLEINPQGEYKLELRFHSQKSDTGVIRAVIEHGLIHIPSNNYVWELGRTYILD